MTRWALSAAALVAAVLLISSSGPAPTARAATGPPNIVVILTDDQRYDGVGSMPNVKRLLVAHGVRSRMRSTTTRCAARRGRPC